MELVPCVNDALEVSSLQRSTTNQTTVDVGLCKELGSVASLAASAIEDAGVVCHLSAVNLSHTAADVSVDFFSLLSHVQAGFIVAATGLCFQYYQQYGPPVPMYLLQVAIAIGSAAVFCTAAQRRDPVLDWLMYGFGVLCLAQVIIAPYFGLGYIAAGLIVVAAPFPAVALARS